MSLKKDIKKYTPRKEQQDALDFVAKNIHDQKFILMDLPVGVGKSYLGLMIADWYEKNIDSKAKFDILTGNKLLQDQYVSEFESINDLKGKDNYQCQQYSCSCAKGKEFNRLNKTSCDYCPWDDAKNSYLGGQISLTNFFLYVLYVLYVPDLLRSRGARVLIVDEAHLFDEVFSSFISVKITENQIKRLKFRNEWDILKQLKTINDIESYIKFLRYLVKEIGTAISDIENEIGGNLKTMNLNQLKRVNKISKATDKKSSEMKLMDIAVELQQLLSKIDIFLKEYTNDPGNWVIESEWNDKTKTKEHSLEPIWANGYLDKYVWSHYDKVILMSGTILNKDLFCFLNGLDPSQTAYHSIPSPFAVTNRPIYYMPIGKMTFKTKEDTFKNYVPYIKKIMSKYDSVKGIIHTHNFELSNWIKETIDNERFIFHDSSNKDEMLRKHMESEGGTVIVSPSVSTGVSFDGEKSRFQIISKIPYPSLASNKNKTRLKVKPDYYEWKTVGDIIQMYGRSVRNEFDFADTIIIDGCFSDVLRNSSYLMPTWFTDAIKKIEIKKTA